jgi:head-tail adaptor
MIRPGRRNRLVRLYQKPTDVADADGYSPLSPASEWVSVEPIAPGDSVGSRALQAFVGMRYRDDVTVDTILKFDNSTRELLVRGVQNVEDAGIDLRLFCEEIVP